MYQTAQIHLIEASKLVFIGDCTGAEGAVNLALEASEKYDHALRRAVADLSLMVQRKIRRSRRG